MRSLNDKADAKMDYKSTLNLPKTALPIKANLPQTEPKILARWENARLYEKILSAAQGQEPFILHDGPPYANGDIHMGHALNKTLKDIIVRFWMLQGKRVPFVPGWDCHGLPIEYALMKELQVTKHQVDIVDFRKKARAYARKYVGIQREQFKRLGCLGDWENPYLTLEPGYVAAALRVLKWLVENRFVYRARKPVNWCWVCETALAEAEVEYEEHTSPSIYVKFPLQEETEKRRNGESEIPKGAYLVIWTTTPWTLMGNVAVAVHPEQEYALRQVGPNEQWITLANLPESARKKLGAAVDLSPVKQVMKGRELEGKRYRHPFGFREGQVVLADYVSMEEGTGLVHTAPGFGAEDYATGKQYGLEVLAPVDSQGRFVGLAEPMALFNGKQVQKANPEVIDALKGSGHLIHAGEESHQYPHCWRCHTPIIFRATDQWFLNVEHQQLREKLLQAVEREVRWIPPEGKERMHGMIKTRPDWCLSRQRLWGIPIPAVECVGCGSGILDPGVVETFARAIEIDPEGSDRWFSEPVEKWLPPGFQCGICRGARFKAGTDILDVWFDSGVSHQGVLTRREELSFPADLYLEGSDQHRGWFQVSLITGVALSGKPPYRAVLTHGFVVDGQGRKMSKSLGNVIAPQDVIASSGADLLRLWVASSDYREDVRLSPKILDQMGEVHRKIRNTLRFMLANLFDFRPAESVVPWRELDELDRWLLGRLGLLVKEVTGSYRQYAFHRVIKEVHQFCTVILSNFYLDVIKDRLYTFHPKDPKRLSSQRALWELARTLILLVAPILPMTAEEIWGALEGAGEGESVHRQRWPDPDRFPQDQALEESWERLLELREQAMKVLEEARAANQIKEALEAELELQVPPEQWDFLQQHREDLAVAAVVSGVEITRAQGAGRVGMEVKPAAGAKCQRCWMRLPTVGRSPEHPGLCHRCVAVLEKLAAI